MRGKPMEADASVGVSVVVVVVGVGGVMSYSLLRGTD